MAFYGVFVFKKMAKENVALQQKMVQNNANNINTTNANPEAQSQEEIKLLNEVGSLILLPANERPAISVIADAKELAKQQAFFAGAINGDVLIAYPNSLKAVVYSPARKLIVNAGPILANPTQQAQLDNQTKKAPTTKKK